MKGPTDIDNWESFFEAFEKVFHHDWANTLSNLQSIGNGTFLSPQFSEATPNWKNRDTLLDAYRKIKPSLDLAVIQVQKFREETVKYETWITGEVFTEKEGFLFRADKPIDGNTTGNVVTLGVRRGLENVLLPMYMKAAEMKATLRLYGVLMPTDALLPSFKPATPETPSVTFVTWKLHSPTDPDELPESERVSFTREDRVSGYRVQLERDPTTLSLMETVLREFELLQHHPRSCVIVMHGFIELLVNSLIEEKLKTGKKMAENNRDYPHSVKLTILFEMGLLVDEEFKKLNWFRKLRNDAAHEAVFAITPEKLQLFVGTKFADVSQFPLLCMDIFTTLWNKYTDLFSTKFSPNGQGGVIVAKEPKGRTFTMRGGT